MSLIYRYGRLPGNLCCMWSLVTPKKGVYMHWNKHYWYQILWCLCEQVYRKDCRMALDRHFVCCFWPPRRPKRGQKSGPDQTLEVPHKSKFKWIGTPHWLYKTPWQTYCLLHRVRQTPQNIDPCGWFCKIRWEQMLNVPCKTNWKWTYTSCTQQNDTCQTFCLLLYDPQTPIKGQYFLG